jgi:hypothetical protein
MAKASKKQASADKFKIGPGADKRLANILKKALSTPLKHVPDKRTRPHGAKKP